MVSDGKHSGMPRGVRVMGEADATKRPVSLRRESQGMISSRLVLGLSSSVKYGQGKQISFPSVSTRLLMCYPLAAESHA